MPDHRTPKARHESKAGVYDELQKRSLQKSFITVDKNLETNDMPSVGIFSEVN